MAYSGPQLATQFHQIYLCFKHAFHEHVPAGEDLSTVLEWQELWQDPVRSLSGLEWTSTVDWHNPL
jgi:hypothetical protein